MSLGTQLSSLKVPTSGLFALIHLYVLSSFPILEASMFIHPVPYFNTFSATVFSLSGLRTSVHNSIEGFKAVPHHSHSVFHFVSVLFHLNSQCVPSLFQVRFTVLTNSLSFHWSLSIAFPTSRLFGNPLPYTQAIKSRISNQASSRFTAIRCCVLVPQATSAWAPGFITRNTSSHNSTDGTS